MKFPLTAQLIEEAERFQLRSACRDCVYRKRDGECLHGWPDEGQRRWPLDEVGADGVVPTEAMFCKEFELR
jgi:hypothetical protein